MTSIRGNGPRNNHAGPASAGGAAGQGEGGAEPLQACPSCGALSEPDDRFCEACGEQLGEPARRPGGGDRAGACRSCGGSVDADGYCERCGAPAAGEANPDHDELDLAWVAAVTDRGRHHRVNEDAVAAAVIGRIVAGVVCDGVSTTPGSALAARRAADVALDTLRAAVAEQRNLRAAMVSGVAAANAEVCATPPIDPANPPACTIVAAVARPESVIIGWLGDSRAYWLDADRGALLTRDDSWAAESVAAGGITAEEADADRRAHHITRWLGPDAPAGDCHVTEFTPPGPGSLVLCTDGLWNYAPVPELLGREAVGPPIVAARRLCEFALTSGGNDNITVIVANLGDER
jgi:serine/threonine protein phosphatase PrpC